MPLHWMEKNVLNPVTGKNLNFMGVFVNSGKAGRYCIAPFSCHRQKHRCIFILLNKLYRWCICVSNLGYLLDKWERKQEAQDA